MAEGRHRRNCDTGEVASGITVALITGGFVLGGTFLGALGAIIGSLLTPWVNWGVEKRRRRHDNRAQLIQQWRVEIRQLRNAENNHQAHNEELKKRGEPEEIDPPEVDPENSGVLRRLKDELPSWALTRLSEKRASPVKERKGQIPDLLEAEVLRIERKWGLPESPL
jgi:hypothetical protein